MKTLHTSVVFIKALWFGSAPCFVLRKIEESAHGIHIWTLVTNDSFS